MLYNKTCKCGAEFIGNGPAAKYCRECAKRRKEEIREADRIRAANYKIKHGLIVNPGSGSGSATGKREAHYMYKHGKYVFETLRNEIKSARRYCERCSKDLIEATHYFWVVHHKDHDHWNHEYSNLELLCKQCHQIEHKCWKNFIKAQRLDRKIVGSSEPKCVGS